jgi:biopolymer transport protein ExbD
MAFSIRRGMTLPSSIPTASMADIAFLLLIFFLTTTIFRLEQGLAIELPAASSAVRLNRQQAIHVWMDRDERLLVGDREVALASLGGTLAGLAAGGEITVSLQIDREVSCETIQRLFAQLRGTKLRNLAFGVRGEEGVPWRVGSATERGTRGVDGP